MKVACFGNILANLPALEAVLADAKRREVSLFLHAGDLIGTGPAVNETLAKLQQEKILTILGPGDSRILKYRQKQTKVGTSSHPDKWLVLKSQYDALSETGRDMLQSLKPKLRLRLEQKTLLILKENPFAKAGPEDPDAPGEPFRKQTRNDIIVWTDGLRPSARKEGPLWIVNAGSLVDQAEPAKAHYTILQWKPGFFQVRHYTVPFQPGAAVPAANAIQAGYPDSTPEESIPVFPETMSETQREPVAKEALEAVNRLLQSCLGGGEALDHSLQVTRLALHLFDRLQPLHQYGPAERFLLQCAALLHDIGWIVGQEGHHKIAFNIISNTESLPFAKRDRYVIGAVARYHRKSTPRSRHLYFATLEPADRKLVTVLASILRSADGLDCSHSGLVTELDCRYTAEEIQLLCTAAAPENGEIRAALHKGTLLEQTFGRKLVIEWHLKQRIPQVKS